MVKHMVKRMVKHGNELPQASPVMLRNPETSGPQSWHIGRTSPHSAQSVVHCSVCTAQSQMCTVLAALLARNRDTSRHPTISATSLACSPACLWTAPHGSVLTTRALGGHCGGDAGHSGSCGSDPLPEWWGQTVGQFLAYTGHSPAISGLRPCLYPGCSYNRCPSSPVTLVPI